MYIRGSARINENSISFRRPGIASKPSHLEILFDDADLIAVVKPAGLATIPGRAKTDSVLERLARQINLACTGSDDPRLRVLHRLDKDTSGVLAFAKHRTAQQVVSHQFQNNTIRKEYLALVVGRMAEPQGRIEADLAVHPTDKLRMAVVKHSGRPAITEWTVEAAFRDCTLLRVFPKTGKTHQIRVHLRHIGHPLLIDPLYNPTPPKAEVGLFLSRFKRGYKPGDGPERPLIARLTLHAERLQLKHPNGNELDLRAPLPKDLNAAIQALTRHGNR
jgi:23S rRNA pseudouridine955/2504/2580 synthase/23S rRNA pseudouridine1911/1915/1917 synthase